MNKSYSLYRYIKLNKKLLLPNTAYFSTINDDKIQPKEHTESPLKSVENSTNVDTPPNDAEDALLESNLYAPGTKPRKQGAYAFRPNKDPRETTIIVFPGQGNQFVGMGKGLMQFPMAKELFELANYILGYDLLKLCLNGPKEKLDMTIYNQPATFVTSLAALERLKVEEPDAIDNCVATAGFSLGEFSALVFAGAIQFEKALQLIKIRAEGMQLACDTVKSGMLICIYGPDCNIKLACKKATEWCLEKGVENPICSVACYLHPNSKFIAGNIEALEFIEKNSKEFNIRKTLRLNVSGAFHTNLMLPAIEPFKKALRKTQINEPLINVHSNVDGKRYKNAGHIVKQLPKQIIKPVKWEQTLHVLYERDQGEYFPATYECGPGKGLKNILKEVNAKAWNSCKSIDTT